MSPLQKFGALLWFFGTIIYVVRSIGYISGEERVPIWTWPAVGVMVLFLCAISGLLLFSMGSAVWVLASLLLSEVPK